MTILRQALYGIALLGSLALLVWGQQQRINLADKNAELATAEAATAGENAGRNLATAITLRATLKRERDAQISQRIGQEKLRSALAKREQTLEVLKRENAELRNWAAQPLPAIARQLRERPTLTGADAYRQWLSGSGAVQLAGDQSGR